MHETEPPADAAALELARLRGLAALASTLLHDLNNHLSSCLALAMQVRPQLRDEGDIAMHDELCHGVQSGSGLSRALVRMLVRGPAPRQLVPAGQLLDDALAAFEKAAQQAGLPLQVRRSPELPMVRTVQADAVASLLLAFTTLLAAKPARLEVTADAAELALAGGRRRRCARVRTLAVGLPGTIADELAAALAGDGGLGVRQGLDRGGIVHAAIAQRAIGGDLTVVTQPSGLELVHAWPASS